MRQRREKFVLRAARGVRLAVRPRGLLAAVSLLVVQFRGRNRRRAEIGQRTRRLDIHGVKAVARPVVQNEGSTPGAGNRQWGRQQGDNALGAIRRLPVLERGIRVDVFHHQRLSEGHRGGRALRRAKDVARERLGQSR